MVRAGAQANSFQPVTLQSTTGKIGFPQSCVQENAASRLPAIPNSGKREWLDSGLSAAQKTRYGCGGSVLARANRNSFNKGRESGALPIRNEKSDPRSLLPNRRTDMTPTEGYTVMTPTE